MGHAVRSVMGFALALSGNCALAAVQMQMAVTGTSSGTILSPGDSATVLLTAPTGSDAFNSAIFRVSWSVPGMTLQSYQWGDPFANGGLFDDSTPAASSLPAVVTSELLSGFGYPLGVADVEFSNVIAPGGPAGFSFGELLRFTFTVPASFEGSQFLVSFAPDTFASGATTREVANTTSLLFVVIPAPGAVAMMGLGVLVAARRRRAQ